MKIIDLFNKIANGEELPKRIKYNNIDYFWCNQCKIYERIEDDSKDLYNDLDNLNDEVEILEEKEICHKCHKYPTEYNQTYCEFCLGISKLEEKKIPEKSNIDFNTKLPVSGCSENEAFMMTCISHLGKTIDSLIEYLKSKGE